jgi:hypothetical protein
MFVCIFKIIMYIQEKVNTSCRTLLSASKYMCIQSCTLLYARYVFIFYVVIWPPSNCEYGILIYGRIYFPYNAHIAAINTGDRGQ